MNVLHVISSGGMYGAEAVILELCQQMRTADQGTGTLGIFSSPGSETPELYREARKHAISAELLHCKGQIDLTIPRQIRDLAVASKADILHAHGYKADVYTAAAYRGRQRPALVSTCHTWYDNDLALRLYGALDRRVLRSFDQVVAVSREVQQCLLAAKIVPHRAHLIRNGVQLPPPRPQGAKSASSDSLTPAATVRIGLVGRLSTEKGIDIFLRAAARVVAALPDTHFVVAGDGPDRQSLEALRDQLGVQSRFTFLGRQSDMASVYNRLDLLVSASRQEGLPIALLEGMAHALPVIATSVGEVPSVVDQGVTGFLVPPEDEALLAAAIQQLATDEVTRQAFGRAGRQRIEEHFSAARMSSDYLDVYHRALQPRPLRPGRHAQ